MLNVFIFFYTPANLKTSDTLRGRPLAEPSATLSVPATGVAPTDVHVPPVAPVTPPASSSVEPFSARPSTPTLYDNYISVIDWSEDDENNPEYLAAIEESIAEYNRNASTTEVQAEEKVTDIINSFVCDNLKSTCTGEGKVHVDIVINRKCLLMSTLRAIERKSFSFLKPLKVKFSGEDAVDIGGPKREFLRLLMANVNNSGIFHRGWFSHDLHLLRNNKYHLAGKLIAWSVLQGGSGARCLIEEAYNIFQDLPVEREAAIEAVSNEVLKGIIKEIKGSTSANGFAVLVEKHADAIADFGYSKIYGATIQEKEQIMDSLLKQNYVFSVYAEIQQFFDGLNAIGKFGELCKKPGVFAAILGNKSEKLTSSAFKGLYKVCFSEEGSNKKAKEDQTIYCFELFLKDLEEDCIDGLQLEDLLVFLTGANAVPPLGFGHEMVLDFYDVSEKETRLPWSSTCSLSLYLPRGVEEPDKFNSLICRSLQECHGFGKC